MQSLLTAHRRTPYYRSKGNNMTEQQPTVPGKLVKMSNDFVRGQLRLRNTVAAKVFISVISCIAPDDKDFQEYSIPVSSVLLDAGGKDYVLLHKALDNVAENIVTIPKSDGPKPSFDKYPLFAKIGYNRENGTITAQVHPDLKPYFFQLARYVLFNRIDALMLSGGYSLKLYMLLMSYAKTHANVEISLENLHFTLETEGTLKSRFPDFRRFVLERAHKEISDKTGLVYEWEPVMLGRKVIAINFIFSAKVFAEKEEAKKLKSAAQDRNANLAAMKCLREKNVPLNAKCPDKSRRLAKCRRCERIREL